MPITGENDGQKAGLDIAGRILVLFADGIQVFIGYVKHGA